MTNNDQAYANAAYIPNGNEYPDLWDQRATQWRSLQHQIGRARLNTAYGDKPRQMFDTFYPAGKPEGLLIFVHGGYWHAFSAKDWSHLAAGATARGWAVVIPSYTLAPAARIADITREIVAAVERAAAMVAGPVVVTGHSAGGHLAARVACRDVALSDDTARRLRKVVPISPLSDLTPLLHTSMNQVLCLDEKECQAESPVNHSHRNGVDITICAGEIERPAFLDQARWLHRAWPASRLLISPARHHFDVLDDLEDPDSALMRAICD